MPTLRYLIGDATNPTHRPALICHCCNNSNGFGRGFVVALSERYPETKIAYHDWFATGSPKLGDVQFVQVTPDVCVANMIGQEGTRWQGKIPPIRYEALAACFEKAYAKALQGKLMVSMPRIGAVLAGGRWETIEEIIKDKMLVDTYVYTLESQRDRWKTNYEK